MENDSPDHSEKYLYRRNNPKNRHKDISEHIAHTIVRMKERFDLEITNEDYKQILNDITINGLYIYNINKDTGLYEFNYKGKTIWALLGNSSKRIGKRIKTVLLPYSNLIVPDKLNTTYDHYTFTEAVHMAINKMVVLSDELDLNNKKDFFMRADISKSLQNGALQIKMGTKPNSIRMIKGAIRYIYSIHHITDSE